MIFCSALVLLTYPEVASQRSICKAQSGAPAPCPYGHFCPAGSAEPHPHYCSNETAAPQKCPAGSYCPTKSGRPILCPPHHFCPEQSSEPQLCPEGYRCDGQNLEELFLAAGPWWQQLVTSVQKFQLVTGVHHNMALVEGQLWVWGHNGHGQLGIGDTNPRLRPVRVEAEKSFVTVATGYWHSLALSAAGELWAWGRNDEGQLGIGNADNQLHPARLALDKSFVAMAAGYAHSLALSDAGELWAWGRNAAGQLGTGNTNTHFSPVQVVAEQSFVAIAAGEQHSLALSDAGELRAWGRNDCGQLGIGNTNNQLYPVRVVADKRFVAIAAGYLHSLALSAVGELWAWGRNDEGQLGIGNRHNQLYPVRVAVDTNFVEIAGGYAHSLSLSASGELWAWGRNDEGQLGIGSAKNQLYPARVAADKSFVGIAAGYLHSFALSSKRRVWGWGHNSDGQLGTGDTNHQLHPVTAAVGQGLVFPCENFPPADCALNINFVGAKKAEPCNAGTFCPAGKGCPIRCPEGHFCNRRAGRPEPCAAGYVCPAGTANLSGTGAEEVGSREVASRGQGFAYGFAGREGFKASCQSDVHDWPTKHADSKNQSAAAEVKPKPKKSAKLEAAELEGLENSTSQLFRICAAFLAGILLGCALRRLAMVETGEKRACLHDMKTSPEDDRTIIDVQYPCALIQDAQGNNGNSQRKIQTNLPQTRGVQPLKWEDKSQFDSQHDFASSEIRCEVCEDDVLEGSSKSIKRQQQVFRVPQVFHMASDDDADMDDTAMSESPQDTFVESLAPNSSGSQSGSSWERW